MILIDAAGLAASRPGKPLFADLSLTLSSGDRLAVVGLNGCGKSTLLRQLAGQIDPDAGTIRRGRGSRVVVLDQDADLVGDGPVPTALAAAGGGWEAEAVLERLGLGTFSDRPVDQLSGGQAKRVALARTLVEVGEVGHDDAAVVLVLDEPTNHLDIDAIAWLEDRLASHRGALLLVTHDRHVLDRVSNRILEIDRGASYVHEGGYDSYLVARAERADRAAQADDVRRNLARKELAWLRRGAKARSRKSKTRVASATALIEGRAEEPARADTLDLSEAARRGSSAKGTGRAGYTEAARRDRVGVPRLGDLVIELEGVGHRFGDGPWLFRDVELRLDPGERLGILGPNGIGKSTLTEIMAGAITPLEGTVITGPTVALGVHRQRGPELDPTTRVRDAVAGPNRVPDFDDARLMEQFWFDTDAQYAPIGLLSGGERRRLHLLLTLAQRPNVLILDEPTNDLDLDTLRVLEDYFDDWPGALVIVSHDRTFLERTVTDVVEIDKGHVRRVPGGYPTWERARIASRSGARPGITASTAVPTANAHTAAPGTRPKSSASVSKRPGTTVPAAAASPQTQKVSNPRPKRSATTLRFMLKDAERDLRRLQRRRDELTVALADPTVRADRDTLADTGRELADVESKLAEVEEQWLELTMESEG